MLFASAMGTMADGPVLFDRSVLIGRSAFIDRPVFMPALFSGLLWS